MKQGDVVILNFPFTDLQHSKIRPALVISNQAFHQKGNVLLVGIYGSDMAGFSEMITSTDLTQGVLKKTSFVRFQNIFTLQTNLVHAQVAALKKEKLSVILERIKSFL